MDNTLKQNGNHVIKEHDFVFYEGHDVHSLNILLQGNIDVLIAPNKNNKIKDSAVKKSFKIFSLDKGTFIGTHDLFLSGNHSLSYLTTNECNIFTYNVENLGKLWSYINSQKDYGTHIINSIYTFIDKSYSTLEKLESFKISIKTITENILAYFWFLKDIKQFEYSPSIKSLIDGQEILNKLKQDNIKVPEEFSQKFIEHSHLDKTEIDTTPEPYKLKREYYQHLNNLPVELRKNFFSTDLFITSYHCRDASECLLQILSEINKNFIEIEHYYNKLYSDNNDCIYTAFVKAATEISMNGYDASPALDALEYIIKKIKDIINLYKKEYCHNCETDIEYLELSFNNLKASMTATPNNNITIGADFNSLPEELKDSAAKILEYADVPSERADFFLMNLLAFRNLRDKLSADDTAKDIRNNISSVFFEIYSSVFKKVYEKKDNSRLLNMFLNYGYMDEKLLEPRQTLEFYKLAGKDASQIDSSVHNMKEWLTNIYEMNKAPSINEFGQDYFDIFRDMKKRGQITDKDKQKYDNDADGRLSFEINNMLRTNHKLCSGQISTYFPILHKDVITRDISKALITAKRIKETLDKILEIDFSAFYREINFNDVDAGIEKELVMKPIISDFILIPIYGSRAMMWQEISGRDRNTPGRFLFPIFTNENLDETMVRLIGNFRWELCRTMMGSAWNDVTQSSLTSEYTDYIQFYKKNKDLSDDAKDKIRMQIQKYHNKMKDIFAADYEVWINNESKGNVRLNKVSRGILFKSCPFSKEIREQLEKQPMYTDLAIQLKNSRAKIAREIENRYSKYIKNNGSIDPMLEHNAMFYKDM